MPLLDILNLEVVYGGIQAVKGISFAVEEGEMVCLIGANGAGKTTTLKAVARMIAARGEMRYRGERLDHLPAHALIGRGLALVPEGRGVFARLTVAENLAMGAYHRSDGEIGADADRIYAMLPRLAERREQLAGTLSGGEQQMLAIGRAMMGRPAMLLLDEPSLGIAPRLVADIFEAIARIAEAGTTILLVEQNTRLALKYSMRAYVLRTGEIAMSGPSKELAQNEEIKKAYLGG
jgi:branched-chain amino acid transport system ATP-binding protein